jgi:hypothetical protein
MGYADKIGKHFFVRFWWRLSGLGRDTPILVCGRAEFVMGQA